ncbi:MAG: radical SAM family heme chaperone HemW [Clostridia bacterium]|nr:radical SAM family heme chaperone HemW [Clostridia bacterium]
MPGIYVHIPFCRSKCRYCDFVSFTDKEGLQDSYAACVIAEAKSRAEELKSYTFDSLYIGGGTPSFIRPDLVAMIVTGIKRYFNLSPSSEVTIEMNPATVTKEKVDLYKKVGINRFSVGLQSAVDSQLEDIGRGETVSDFVSCAKILYGENFSADVMIGLTGQSAEDVEKTIELAASLGAKHISMYALTPEEGTPMYSDYLNGDLPDGDEVAALYDAGYKKLKSLGFVRYEVSNFTLPGFQSRHNVNYWKRGEYIGLGVAAASHIKDERFSNTESLDEYFKCILSGHYAEVSREKIEGQDKKDEFIMLSLRTAFGVDTEKYKEIFGEDFFMEFEKSLDTCKKFLDISEGNVRIKEEYLFVQNSIIIEFLGL